jgi:hypothetical protein
VAVILNESEVVVQYIRFVDKCIAIKSNLFYFFQAVFSCANRCGYYLKKNRNKKLGEMAE